MKKLKFNSFAKLKINNLRPSTVPGTIQYIGKDRDSEIKLNIIKYNNKTLQEEQISTIEESKQYIETDSVTWLNISGVHDENIIKDVGSIYNVHPLVLEDTTNTTQRPKLEDYSDYLYLTFKMAKYNSKTNKIEMEQISLIVWGNLVLSLQEVEGDVLDKLRNRIRNSKGKIRSRGSDYLMYSIIDSIVDYYFTVLEYIGNEIEALEEKLLDEASQEILNGIYGLKKEIVFLRNSIWPMRELVSLLQRSDCNIIHDNTNIYLKDVYDHTIQVIETVESFRDITSGMLDLYLSTVSNKMNEIMKVLTIFAAIFIPLTFIAGVYGMNFEFMPELSWKYSYIVWWTVIGILGLGMVLYFKKKKWF